MYKCSFFNPFAPTGTHMSQDDIFELYWVYIFELLVGHICLTIKYYCDIYVPPPFFV